MHRRRRVGERWIMKQETKKNGYFLLIFASFHFMLKNVLDQCHELKLFNYLIFLEVTAFLQSLSLFKIFFQVFFQFKDYLI